MKGDPKIKPWVFVMNAVHAIGYMRDGRGRSFVTYHWETGDHTEHEKEWAALKAHGEQIARLINETV